MKKRIAKIIRKTKETSVEVKINLDGDGKNKVSTTIPFFDHMLEHLSVHSNIDLFVKAFGDTNVDDHHLVEDIGISLGLAFSKALGNRKGISRYGEVITPMDEALSYIAIDISGRPHLSYNVKFKPEYKKFTFDFNLIKEFLVAFVNNAKINLHIRILEGSNNHHICESVFKSLGRVIRQAVSISHKNIPSTKGVL